MKSAYELAMERLGGTTRYSEEQKRRFSEIDDRYDAKVAEERLSAEERARAAAGDKDKLADIQRQFDHELARIASKREAEKAAVKTGKKLV